MSKKQIVAIFGAGELGSKALNSLRKSYNILYFIDNNKHGETKCNLPVYSLEAAKIKPVDHIFIASMFYDEIRAQLLANHIYHFSRFQQTHYFSRGMGALNSARYIGKETRPLYCVYQHGKVGSSSVLAALKRQKKAVLNAHTFRSTNLFLEWSIPKNIQQNMNWLLSKPGPSIAKFNFLKRQRKGLETTIITGVREPVGRAISCIFQGLHHLLPIHMDEVYLIEEDFLTTFNQLFYSLVDFDYHLSWFDKEFAQVTGFNTVNQTTIFDHETGLATLENGSLKCLVYRQDKLEALQQTDFNGHLTGISEVWGAENRASNKWYSELYNVVKKEFFLPRDYLEKIYSSRYCQTFFTHQERQMLIDKWAR